MLGAFALVLARELVYTECSVVVVKAFYRVARLLKSSRFCCRVRFRFLSRIAGASKVSGSWGMPARGCWRDGRRLLGCTLIT